MPFLLHILLPCSPQALLYFTHTLSMSSCNVPPNRSTVCVLDHKSLVLWPNVQGDVSLCQRRMEEIVVLIIQLSLPCPPWDLLLCLGPRLCCTIFKTHGSSGYCHPTTFGHQMSHAQRQYALHHTMKVMWLHSFEVSILVNFLPQWKHIVCNCF
jgi:hypothetical protein